MPRLQHPFNRDAQAADEADHPAGLGPHVRAHAICRVVDSIDRGVDRLIDAFGLLLHFRGHVLHVFENRVHARHRRRHLPCLEARHQLHDLPIRHEARDAQPDDDQRLEHADRRHDAEQQIRGSQFACHCCVASEG
jgi:hypothetical protein